MRNAEVVPVQEHSTDTTSRYVQSSLLGSCHSHRLWPLDFDQQVVKIAALGKQESRLRDQGAKGRAP